MMAPQEIDDEEYEQVLERVAAVDVAKGSGMVCTRVPHPSRPGKRQSRVWQVDADTGSVMELADHLASEGVAKVALEAGLRLLAYLVLPAGGTRPGRAAGQRPRRGECPGRPKSDKLDCVWQAKLTERGMLRPSFVPPAEIRRLRDYTRLRTDLTRERTRHWSRLEKLLEDVLIKVTSVASKTGSKPVRDMLEALIAGERDPEILAGLARGKMRARHDRLVEALTGRFDDHHGELARMLLDQIDALTAHIDQITGRAGELIAVMPAARGVDADGTTGPGAGEAVRPAIARLDEIPGISRHTAQVIVAEVGLDMTRFPTAGHLVSWAKLSPRTIQSGAKSKPGTTGKGNPYLKGALGEAAAAAARTDSSSESLTGGS
jgi:transposase